MKSLKSFFKKPPVKTRSHAATEFYELWRGAQLDFCKVVQQPCLYVKSRAVLRGRWSHNPCCPGCIFMHVASGSIDLTTPQNLEEGFTDDGPEPE